MIAELFLGAAAGSLCQQAYALVKRHVNSAQGNTSDRKLLLEIHDAAREGRKETQDPKLIADYAVVEIAARSVSGSPRRGSGGGRPTCPVR